MKQLLLKMTLMLIMVMCAGVQGYAQYHRYHRPVRGYYHRPYYGYYYAPRVVYAGGYYSAYPRTVVVERPVVYSTSRTTTTIKTEENAELKIDGVTVERVSAHRVEYKGPKTKGVINTENQDYVLIPTKKGSVVLESKGDDKVNIIVYHGDKAVNKRQL